MAPHLTLHLLTALLLVAPSAATGATAHQARASRRASSGLQPSVDTRSIGASQASGSGGRSAVNIVVLAVKYAATTTLLVLGAGVSYVVFVFASLIFATCNDCTLFNVSQLLLYGFATAIITLIQGLGVFGDVSWIRDIIEEWIVPTFISDLFYSILFYF